MTPLLVINTKTYAEATGEQAVALAKLCDRIAKETGVKIVITVPPTDLVALKNLGIDIYAQHMDFYEAGAHTGSVIASALKNTGATGTLINHAEKRLDFDSIAKTVQQAKAYRLTSIVCVATAEETEKAAMLQPDYIAIEPPELIGGEVSVTTASPECITDAVKQAGDVAILCGAGVKTAADAEKAIELGAQGILVASGVVLADNKEEKIRELCTAMIRQ